MRMPIRNVKTKITKIIKNFGYDIEFVKNRL